MIKWVKTEKEKDVEIVFLMEATGVYYESLAHYLHGQKQTVHVVLPNTSNIIFQV
jgi:transposase